MLLDSGYVGDVTYVSAAVLKAMGAMRYDAVGISYRDYLLGEDYVKAADEAGVAVVSSGESAETLGSEKHPYRILEAEGRKVGVASFFWPRGAADYTPAALASRAAAVLGRLRAECDVVVLLSQLSLPMDKTLLAFPQVQGLVDVVIGGASEASLTEPLVVNGTTIVPTSPRGWDVGVVEVSFPKLRRPQLTVHLERVDLTLPEDAAVNELIQPALLRQAGEQRLASLRNVPIGTFERASVCGRCHQAEWADWQRTAHAAALETLRQEHKLTDECIVCHSEEYRRTRRIPQVKTRDEGVECSSCHGPGLRHSQGQQPKDVRAKVTPSTCGQCHTPERGEFNFEEEVAKVSHNHAALAPRRAAGASADRS